jgi:hypothetical protein
MVWRGEKGGSPPHVSPMPECAHWVSADGDCSRGWGLTLFSVWSSPCQILRRLPKLAGKVLAVGPEHTPTCTCASRSHPRPTNPIPWVLHVDYFRGMHIEIFSAQVCNPSLTECNPSLTDYNWLLKLWFGMLLVQLVDICKYIWIYSVEWQRIFNLLYVYRRELNLAISSSPVTKTMYLCLVRCTAICMEKEIFSSAPGRLDDPSRVPSWPSVSSHVIR